MDESIEELIRSDFLICAETKFKESDCGIEGTFLEGVSTAYYYPELEENDLRKEQLAKAKVVSILHTGFSPDQIYESLDNHSQDFESVGCSLMTLLNVDDERWEEDITFSTTRIIILEWFEVLEKYRNKGLGKILARKILYSAAAKGECVIIQPKLGESNGNQPDRLKNFWMGLDEGMTYDSEFNTMYTSVFH